MNINTYIDSLVCYAMNCGLAEPCDHMVLTNRLLDLMGESEYTPATKIIGENIIKWSQLKIRQVVQHLFFMITRKGHQIKTQIRSQI